MPFVIIVDNSLSMLLKVYAQNTSIISTVGIFAQKFINSFIQPCIHHMALYTKNDNITVFRREPKYMSDILKELVKNFTNNVRGEFRYLEAVKKCDKELTKTWGCSSLNHIIILTDGERREFMLDETDNTELDSDFRSMIHIVSFTDYVSPPLRSMVERTGGTCVTARAEWMSQQLAADVVAQRLLTVMQDCTFHLWSSSATIKQGHFWMRVRLFPFVDLRYCDSKVGYRFENDKKTDYRNLQVDIIGFLALADMNYPCASSDHVVIHDLEESDDMQPSLQYAHLINTGLLNTKSAAICMVKYASSSPGPHLRYGFIRSVAAAMSRTTLKLCLLPIDYSGLPWLGRFSAMLPCSDNPEAYSGGDKTPFPIQLADECSYRTNGEPDAQQYTTWVCSPNTVANDLSKIVRISKRLPDRRAVFYRELNRFKDTSLAIGSPVLVSSVCRMLEKEQAASATNQEARDIIRYVLESLTGTPAAQLSDANRLAA